MLAKRIIPCLDVMNGRVVKGVRFKGHEVIGDVLELALRYRDEGADELVFYDITASAEDRVVCKDWIEDISKNLDIPFCVAGGIRSLDQAKAVLNAGVEKISINSPALENPDLIRQIAGEFGSQALVVGIDSRYEGGDYFVYQYTGSTTRIQSSKRRTMEWIQEAQELGAGEIVLNCMNQDGVRKGYDIVQLSQARKICQIPLIASGGAGRIEDFCKVFQKTDCDGALAASVFHKNLIDIMDLKGYLNQQGVRARC